MRSRWSARSRGALRRRVPCAALLLLVSVPATVAADAGGDAAAAEAPNEGEHVEARHRFYADADPFAYLFRGFSIHAGITPKKLSRWRFGVGAVQANYPDFYVRLVNPDNAGWTVREQLASALVVRSFSPDRRGFFLGLHSLFLVDRLGLEGYDQQVSSRRLEFLPHGGYMLFPLRDHGLYLSAWMGLGLNVRLDRDRPEIDGRMFEEPVLRPFATFHIGYEL